MDSNKATVLVNATVDVVKLVRTKGYKSKSVLFGVGLTVLGVVQTFMPDLASVMGSHVGTFSTLVGLATIVLRAVTNSPLADK